MSRLHSSERSPGRRDVRGDQLEVPLEDVAEVPVAVAEGPMGGGQGCLRLGIRQSEDALEDQLRPRLPVGEGLLPRQEGLGDHAIGVGEKPCARPRYGEGVHCEDGRPLTEFSTVLRERSPEPMPE